MIGLKDDHLASIAETGNVAQFVSFGPGEPRLRHAFIAGDPDLRGKALVEIVETLRIAAPDQSVNVRSFLPGRDKGCPFHYGLRSAHDAAALVRSLSADGFYTIVNETIDVHDGGVSGVALGGMIEFAPDDTPRAVEKPGIARAPHDLGLAILRTVYGFVPDVPEQSAVRLEFSVHPNRRGYRRSHTLWWEVEKVARVSLDSPLAWPNRFSRLIGDKTYGLLVADALGLTVPQTTVVSRRVAPFRFGVPTGTSEHWLRTCPIEQVPGKFSTLPRWVDPYALMAKEDTAGDAIAAVLSQEGVDAQFSGATMPSDAGSPDHVEGVRGVGESFMLGEQAPEDIPNHVADDVRAVTRTAAERLGPVRLEWAHDGHRVWVLQMHVATHLHTADEVMSPGEAETWIPFNVSEGLEHLRSLVPEAKRQHAGVLITGRVGLTSHIGDVLRKASVPARLANHEA